jgi:hypothetical protein
MSPPLSLFPVAGGPKSYESTETLVLYIKFSLLRKAHTMGYRFLQSVRGRVALYSE